MKRALIMAGLTTTALSLSGCSWFTGWFGTDVAGPKPAELVGVQSTLDISRAWDVSVGSGQPYHFAPASDGQAVYAASRDGRIVKIDLNSGRELWRINADKTLSAGVEAGEGLVLVGTPKGELLAFGAADGAPAWSAKLTGEVLTAPVAGGGYVAVRSNDGKIWLLSAADGKQRWVYSRAMPALTLREPGDLVITDKLVYAGYPGGKLVAISVANGAPVWEVNVAIPRGVTELERIADVTGTVAIDATQICAAAYQGRVACFNRQTGEPVWGRDISSLRGVDMDTRQAYVADTAGMLQAFELQRGSSPWKQDKLHDRQLSSPLSLGRYVAVGDYQGYVHLLNTDDGAFAGRVSTDGSPIVGRMLALDAGFIVQTSGGGVYAFKFGERKTVSGER